MLSPFGVTTAQFFLINAVTYLFVILALLRMHMPTVPKVAHGPGWRQFTSGLRIARANPASRRLLLTLFTFSFISLPFVGLFPAVARLNFGIDERVARTSGCTPRGASARASAGWRSARCSSTGTSAG